MLGKSNILTAAPEGWFVLTLLPYCLFFDGRGSGSKGHMGRRHHKSKPGEGGSTAYGTEGGIAGA